MDLSLKEFLRFIKTENLNDREFTIPNTISNSIKINEVDDQNGNKIISVITD